MKKSAQRFETVKVINSLKACPNCKSRDLELSDIDCAGPNDRHVIFLWWCNSCENAFDSEYSLICDKRMDE